MKASPTQVSLFLLASWLTFRYVSDLPIGWHASGMEVSALGMVLSYIGLVPWLILATPVVFTIGGLADCLRGDTIARAHAAFIVVQVYGWVHSCLEFGTQGFVAGAYVIAVCINYLYIYILGLRVGAFADHSNPVVAWNRTAKVLTWTLLPCLAIALFQLVTANGRDVDGVLRVYGGTSSPNMMGALLLVFFGTSAFCRVPSRVFGRGVIVAALCAFIACFSMTGFVAIAFSVALYMLLRARAAGRIRIKISWLIFGLIFLYLVAILAGTVLSDRLHELQDKNNSLVWRLRTWQSYYALLSDPRTALFGAGLGIDHLGMPEQPHNEWLRVLAETGLFGTVFFALTWVRLIKALSQIAKLPGLALQQRSTALLAAVAGLMLWGAGDSVLRTAPSALLVWAASGLLIGYARSYVKYAASGDAASRMCLPRGDGGLQTVLPAGQPESLAPG